MFALLSDARIDYCSQQHIWNTIKFSLILINDYCHTQICTTTHTSPHTRISEMHLTQQSYEMDKNREIKLLLSKILIIILITEHIKYTSCSDYYHQGHQDSGLDPKI